MSRKFGYQFAFRFFVDFPYKDIEIRFTGMSLWKGVPTVKNQWVLSKAMVGAEKNIRFLNHHNYNYCFILKR